MAEPAEICCDPELPCAPPITAGDGTFTLYVEGDELYAAMLDRIAAAKKTIRLESYIFADDEIGRRFADRLVEAAARGVRVRVMIDAAGSLFWVSRKLGRRLQDNGVDLRWFHRWSWRHPLRYNRRNHRKLLVVDDELAFLGGFNIHKENSRKIVGDERWRDTHVEVSRELAVEAARQFDAVWDHDRKFADWIPANAHAAVVSNISRNCRQRFRCLFLDLIDSAKRSVYATTPYFVPGRRLQGRLCDASQRGVDVRLLLPAKSDVRIVQWAARALYSGLLKSGVRIFEYQPRTLHAKCAVIDGEWSLVGSANLDTRSFSINYEVLLAARNPRLSAQLTTEFHTDLQQSAEIRSEQWTRRPWMERGYEWLGGMMQRWL